MSEDREEIQRILEALRMLIRMLGYSNREIERRLGMTPSYLSRLFNGYLEVRLQHVLSVGRALGLKPGEAFQFIYPQRADPPSEAAQQVRRMLEDLHPTNLPANQPPPPPTVTVEMLERRFLEALRQILDEPPPGGRTGPAPPSRS